MYYSYKMVKYWSSERKVQVQTIQYCSDCSQVISSKFWTNSYWLSKNQNSRVQISAISDFNWFVVYGHSLSWENICFFPKSDYNDYCKIKPDNLSKFATIGIMIDSHYYQFIVFPSCFCRCGFELTL